MGLLFDIYVCIRLYIDHWIDYLFGLYFNPRRKYIPNIKNHVIFESATSLSIKIRKGQMKAEYIVTTFIQRIKEVNGILNAVVDNRFEDAILEAKQIDEDIRTGKITELDFEERPFLGIPFTTKESTACKGLKWSLGLLCRDFTAEEDAKVIELMKKAGGILIGITNVPQLNLWTETYNPVYGVTNNPYNTTRNVGGSSGGEASIIAAGGSPIGIGSDIGGSLRIPSFRCGLFAHKGSSDLISCHGLGYRKGDEGPTMVVAGPMTRYAEDLTPLLKVLSNDNVKRLQLDAPVDIKKLGIFYMTSIDCILTSPVQNDVTETLNKVVNYFHKTQETAPKQVKFENTKFAVKLWSYMMTQENSDYKSELMNKKGQATLTSALTNTICNRSEFSFYVLYNLVNDILPKPSHIWAQKVIEDLKNEIVEKLGSNGVLLFPSEAFPASYHYTSLLRPYNMSYYALWNVLKMPVTQVPLGLNSDGLPLGIQVVAAPYQDHLCIAVAKELEKAFGGYVPPLNPFEPTNSFS